MVTGQIFFDEWRHAMRAQQLAVRFDVGSGKQHTIGSGHARNASASGGPRAARSSRPRLQQQQVVAGGRSMRQAARGHGEGGHGGGERKT